MAEDNGFRLFGFRVKSPEAEARANNQSFVAPQHDDGALVLETGGHYAAGLDMMGTARNEIELITRYREMAMQPELEIAIDHVTNEAIVDDDTGQSVKINLDSVEIDKNVKTKISGEFKTVLKLLNWTAIGHDTFKRFYVDGRLNYDMIINKAKPGDGIQELRYIDPRRLKKVREVSRTKDQRTGADLVDKTEEYYIYNERGTVGAYTTEGLKISPDRIAAVNSGLMDARRAMVLSYLHKAIKPLNQLRMMEDATVVYKVSRAPDRRVFYIDVGNLPKTKAEQYLRDIMTKYRNKLTYDSTTGEIRDDRKFMSMLEDFWLPRRGETGKGTEIQTLPGGESLANMDNVVYFQKKLYQSLTVPVGRLLPSDGFSLGRTNEISREEIAFTKFIARLRKRFSGIFDIILGMQCVLKGICSKDDWESMRTDIVYDWLKDNNFEEMKEQELLTSRAQLATLMDPFVGRYVSGAWMRKKVWRFSDEQIKQLDEEIADETEKQSVMLPPTNPASPFYVDPNPDNGQDQQTEQPDPDQTMQKALTPGESDADAAFGRLKVNEEYEPETLNTIERILEIRKRT